MNFGSLFAGIGGFDLGLERAGMECKWQVEIDDFCNRVLEKHWPNVKRYRDVREVGKHNLEPVDLICGGFPCQPFSVAGKRGRTGDDRHLWPAMLNVIRDVSPRWAVMENVPGLDDEHEMVLDQVCADLEGIGYEVAPPFEIPACAVDADHLRFRIFIVAHTERHGVQWGAIETAAGEEKTRAQQLARLLFPATRSTVSLARTYRDGHGVRSRMDARRNKALGNAVVPQVVEIIGKAIMETERRTG